MNKEVKSLYTKLNKAKDNKEYAIIHKQINELQDNCKHDFEIKDGYKICKECDFTDIYIPRKRKSKIKGDLF